MGMDQLRELRINKFLKYFTVFSEIDYKIIPKLEDDILISSKVKSHTIKDILFTCNLCDKEFEIGYRQDFWDGTTRVADIKDFYKLINHIRINHKDRLKLVPEKLIEFLRKKTGSNQIEEVSFWRVIGNFDSLEKGNSQENCRLCGSFDKDFSFCYFHIEFISKPNSSKCSDFRIKRK